jgi:hypothetical protein
MSQGFFEVHLIVPGQSSFRWPPESHKEQWRLSVVPWESVRSFSKAERGGHLWKVSQLWPVHARSEFDFQTPRFTT